MTTTTETRRRVSIPRTPTEVPDAAVRAAASIAVPGVDPEALPESARETYRQMVWTALYITSLCPSWWGAMHFIREAHSVMAHQREVARLYDAAAADLMVHEVAPEAVPTYIGPRDETVYCARHGMYSLDRFVQEGVLDAPVTRRIVGLSMPETFSATAPYPPVSCRQWLFMACYKGGIWPSDLTGLTGYQVARRLREEAVALRERRFVRRDLVRTYEAAEALPPAAMDAFGAMIRIMSEHDEDVEGWLWEAAKRGSAMGEEIF